MTSLHLKTALTVAFVVTISASERPRGAWGATVTQVGNPLFDVEDVSLFSIQILGNAGEDLFPGIELALQPNHTVYVSPAPGSIMPSVPHGPPYDDEVSTNIAALGGVEGSVFEPQHLRVPFGLILTHTIAANENAPLGKSFDFAEGHVLPREIYPLTVMLEIELNHGAVISGGPIVGSPLPDGPAVDEMGNTVDFSGLLESHYHGVFLPFTAPPFVPDAALRGDYEWRFTVRDGQGNGWDVAVPFSIVPEPSAIAYCLTLTLAWSWLARRRK